MRSVQTPERCGLFSQPHRLNSNSHDYSPILLSGYGQVTAMACHNLPARPMHQRHRHRLVVITPARKLLLVTGAGTLGHDLTLGVQQMTGQPLRPGDPRRR